MKWTKFFKSQSYNQPTWKHIELPIYQTKEFDFFRCLEFNESFYGKTASELFNGNLRYCSGRYSSLFPGRKISYWADSPMTAHAEIKKHGSGRNILTFWAYDDPSSFIPCLGEQDYLIILDGRKSGIQLLIDKLDCNETLTSLEKEYMKKILNEKFDCIAYDSKARIGGENFIFLESGFKKLALRQLRLRFSRKEGGSNNFIYCAGTSDYTPYLRGYGECFMPKCRIVMNNNYLNSQEYLIRCNNVKKEYENKTRKRKNRIDK